VQSSASTPNEHLTMVIAADAALVLSDIGPVLGIPEDDEGQDTAVKQYVKRVVLQRQKDVEDEDSDFLD
jgi:hypothetical protein